MDWKGLGKKIIGIGAPVLGTVVCGPAGAKIGSLISNALGGKSNDPEEISRLIDANPEAAARLMELEMKHKERLEELTLENAKLDVEEEKAYLADRQDARNREVEITRATGKRDLNLYILAWVVIGGFFGLMALLLLSSQAQLGLKENSNLPLLFGGLVSGFSMVLAYFFGSSLGSARKTELMKDK